MHDGVHKVEILSTSTHLACLAARVLPIGPLSSAYNPSYQPTRRYGRGNWMTDLPSEDPPEVAVAEKKLVAHLFDAITSLRGVQCVK